MQRSQLSQCSHYDDLDGIYNYNEGTLKRSGQTLVSNNKCARKQDVVSGWNEQVKELHSTDRDADWLWREIDKPRQCDIFRLMKLSRIKLKHAITKYKKAKKL